LMEDLDEEGGPMRPQQGTPGAPEPGDKRLRREPFDGRGWRCILLR
jgi:hypothetical protein